MLAFALVIALAALPACGARFMGEMGGVDKKTGMWTVLLKTLDTWIFGALELEGDKKQAMHVIGAGLPRTGTDSLRTALEELGYYPHHMARLWDKARLEDQYWVPFLRDLIKHDTADVPSAEPLMDYLSRAGYNATTDAPAVHLFPVLMTKYPNAKVILGVRDRPRDWALSVRTLLRMSEVRKRLPWKWIMHETGNYIWPAFKAIVGKPVRASDTVEELEEVYKLWENIVRAIVPKDRLLIHNSKQGWGPICKFLELRRCPRTPYPRGNDGTNLGRVVENLEFISDFFWELAAFSLATLLLLLLGLHWLCCMVTMRRKAVKKD